MSVCKLCSGTKLYTDMDGEVSNCLCIEPIFHPFETIAKVLKARLHGQYKSSLVSTSDKYLLTYTIGYYSICHLIKSNELKDREAITGIKEEIKRIARRCVNAEH